MDNSKVQELEQLRHSCAHLLAAAVLKLWPGTKNTIGPAIENGFYYDFDFAAPISDDDLPRIEKEMSKIIQSWKEFSSQELTYEKAKEMYKDNEYKLELIEQFKKENQKITIYKSGDFTDLCRGGHTVTPSKKIRHYKLQKIAGAYWRGDEKNKMLTRIYGTCFFEKEELLNHFKQLEEAKNRDHKVLGKKLGLFVFSDTVGKGLPLWTPKGATVRRILERFIIDEEIKRGYLHVYTPDIANLELYKKSGHYPYYKETMYSPIKIDDEEYMLRPMTCPHHFELYLTSQHSYRELPIRYAELAQLYRYEQSGELMGLLRVRTFCLADAHIIARKSQAKSEINAVLDLIDFVCSSFGLKLGENYRYRLSLGNRKDEKKYFKDDASWDEAEKILKEILTERKSPFYEAQDEAAFYGPKIDIQMTNVSGKEDTAFTVQYDFVMPKRFELKYTNEDGKDEEPVVIHRSSIGAIERIFAYLIEHYNGNFPLWLAPVQIQLISVSEKCLQYAREIKKILENAGIRVNIDERSLSMQSKIREAALQKIPFMGIIGEKEIELSVKENKHYLNIRKLSGENIGNVNINSFLLKLKQDIESKN